MKNSKKELDIFFQYFIWRRVFITLGIAFMLGSIIYAIIFSTKPHYKATVTAITANDTVATAIVDEPDVDRTEVVSLTRYQNLHFSPGDHVTVFQQNNSHKILTDFQFQLTKIILTAISVIGGLSIALGTSLILPERWI